MNKKTSKTNGRITIILLSIIVVLLLVTTVATVSYLSKDNSDKKVENAIDEKLVKEVNNNLKDILQLPTDEKPGIGTIQNLDDLKANPFFDDAKVGDRIIIYSKTKRVVLYRMEENRIINICWYSCQLAYSNT